MTEYIDIGSKDSDQSMIGLAQEIYKCLQQAKIPKWIIKGIIALF